MVRMAYLVDPASSHMLVSNDDGDAFEGNVKALKVTYHPVYGMNNFVTNKSKLPQDGA